MNPSLPVLPPEVLGGSMLCMSCGLCCTGLLHPDAYLDADETETAARLGLTVNREANGGLTFSLPCRHLQHDRCGVYPDRPSVCSKYYCALLKRHVLGEVSLEEAREIVEETRSEVAQLRELIDSCAASGTSFWAEVAEFSDRRKRELGERVFHASYAPFLLRIFQLRKRCQDYFVPQWELPPAKPREAHLATPGSA